MESELLAPPVTVSASAAARIHASPSIPSFQPPVNFYGADNPCVGDVVYVEALPSSDAQPLVPVALLEFSGLTGSIALEEVSVNRKKKSKVGLRPGKRFPALVLRMDIKDSGHIYLDLSKRAVVDCPDKAEAATVRYLKASILNRVLTNCAARCDMSSESAIQTIAWPSYPHALDKLLLLASSPTPSPKLETLTATSPHLADHLHTALRCVRHLLCESDCDNITHLSDIHQRLCDTSAPSSPQCGADQGPDGFEDEVADLIADGMTKLGDFDTVDVIHTIRVQLVSLCQQLARPVYDCPPAVLTVLIDQAMSATLDTPPPPQPRAFPVFPIEPVQWTPLQAKTFLSHLKRLTLIWAPLMRKLMDQTKITLISDLPAIPCGQFELLSFLAEFCSQSFTLALPGFFRDLVFLLYHEKKIDLLDEDTIIVWDAHTRAGQDSGDDVMYQLLADLRPMVDWLKE